MLQTGPNGVKMYASGAGGWMIQADEQQVCVGWLDEVCLLASIPDPPHPQKAERALMSMMVRQANGLSRASGVNEQSPGFS